MLANQTLISFAAHHDPTPIHTRCDLGWGSEEVIGHQKDSTPDMYVLGASIADVQNATVNITINGTEKTVME